MWLGPGGPLAAEAAAGPRRTRTLARVLIHCRPATRLVMTVNTLCPKDHGQHPAGLGYQSPLFHTYCSWLVGHIRSGSYGEPFGHELRDGSGRLRVAQGDPTPTSTTMLTRRRAKASYLLPLLGRLTERVRPHLLPRTGRLHSAGRSWYCYYATSRSAVMPCAPSPADG